MIPATVRDRAALPVAPADGGEWEAVATPTVALRHGARAPEPDGSVVGEVVLTIGLGVLGLWTAGVVCSVVALRRRRVHARRAGDAVALATDVVGRRVGQFLVDYLAWVVPTCALALLPGPSGPLGCAVSLAWGWFTYAWWPARHGGRTWGMRLVGLRVVTVGGATPGVGAHGLRLLLLPVDLLVLGLVGLISVSASRAHQRLGDIVASTVVVPAATGGRRAAAR